MKMGIRLTETLMTTLSKGFRSGEVNIVRLRKR
jgi:hypothetical protein